MRKRVIRKKQYERRVRLEAAIIYFVAIVLCVGVFFYFSNLRKSIQNQRNNIARNERILSITNELIQHVNEAQSYAQTYTFTGDPAQLIHFEQTLTVISNNNDTLAAYYKNNDTNLSTVNDILSLMQRKENIIKQISHQYDIFNPYEEINKLLSNYHAPEKKIKIIPITKQDTIIKKADKKSFFQRIFSSDNAHDSIILVTTTYFDTITEKTPDNKEDLMKDIQVFSEKGRRQYLERLNKIERQYQDFIKADQKISEELSQLLLLFHKQTLSSVMHEIQISESIITRNINYSIYTCAIALVCIFIFIFLIFRDMRKVSKARKETEDARRQTEEIMNSRHKLLLSVSHDIKAPLASIIGNIELMQIDGPKNNDERLESMKYSSEHILSLLSNLLEFSSLEQGKKYVVRSDFNASLLCDKIAAIFRPIAENKHLNLIYHKTLPDDFFINSDSLKIKQIVSNILSNAIKYTIEGDIHFGVYYKNNRLVFSVIDQGIGIPENKIDMIFTPFCRIEDNKSAADGNGFGLYVVKGLIELLGGKLSVKSEIDKGSHFEIEIPVKQVEKVKEAKPDTHNTLINKKLNILIIDDDNTLLAVISSMISKLGHEADICRSSSEFEKCLSQIEKYEYILTDREMGVFSGKDVLRAIKKTEPSKKVVIMTARDEYSEREAKSEGFYGYLKKPFLIKDLAKLLGINALQNDSYSCKYSEDFPQLCRLFNNDEEAVKEVLTVFARSTVDNLVLLNDAIDTDDFGKAQALCHKMRPMFVQLEHSGAEFLSEVDGYRGENKGDMPQWKEKGIGFLKDADALLSLLSDRYDID
ncbi:MAG: hybrid sensor histidine kinase/response regulator [Candidatus Limimorpha sp.]